MTESRRRRVRWWWFVVGALVIVVALVAVIAVPILTHQDQGGSNQAEPTEEWPLRATATGDDDRTRTIDVLSDEPGGTIDTSALEPGQHVVVSGTGYDGSRGIYVAICKVPDEGGKPGPCLGGVPDTEGEQVEQGTVQWAPSNWINDDWAWKLFGARSYDDHATGTFTAYLEVPLAADENVDCTVDACGIFTRNDHTAAADRVQDLYVPVAFAPQ